MKILLICSRIPYPLKDGGAIATFQMVQELSKLGHDVTLLSLNTKKHYVEQKVIDEVFIGLANVLHVPIDTTVKISSAFKNIWSSKSYNIKRFSSKLFAQKVKMEALINQYDVIQFEGLFVANYIKEIEGCKGIKVLRQHNVEHQIWEGLVKKERSFLKRAYLKLLAKRMKKEELGLVPMFDTVVSISPSDTEFFKSHTNKPIYTCPVGVEWKEIMPVVNKKIYHIGSMEWMPNREGVQWFLDKVWPIILIKEPNAQFYLAGKGLDKQEFKGLKQVIVEGEVESLEEFSKDKSVLIVPLFSGSGVRVKILEALALGKNIVSTSQGIQGLLPGHCIPTAESPVDFADLIIRQLDAKCNLNSKEYLDSNYQPQMLVSGLVEFYNSLFLSKKI